MEESEEERADEEEEGSDEEEELEIPEMLVPNRSRRANAGRKMQELLNRQIETEGGKDEFYTTAYGGFQEFEQDDDFQSPPHSSDEEEHEDVDSDFDRPEDEEDTEEQASKLVEDAERMERRRKKLKQKQLLERNKNWAIARINKMSVPENNCDPKTQRQRLAEAKKTAELNIASLKRFEEFELERKKRQTKGAPKRILEGPRIKEISMANGKHLLILPELLPKEQLFPRPNRREYRVCAVTSKPARYTDPLTKLPYADLAAFRTIREKYKQYLAEIAEEDKSNGKDGSSNGCVSGPDPINSSTSTGGFSAGQPTPAKQRKVVETTTTRTRNRTNN